MDKISTRRLGLQDWLLNLVLPKCCVGCGRFGSYICHRCALTKLQPYYVQQCHVCRHEARTLPVHVDCRQSTYLDGVTVAYVYNGLAEKLMAMIKYQFYFAVIEDVARLVAAVAGSQSAIADSAISYIPAHEYREKWRGFNQAQILASAVASLSGKSCEDLLARTELTHSQVGQGKQGREDNLRQAFAVNAALKVLPQKVTLVDDVMTTGSTLEQCARVLKAAGVREVYGLVFARGWYLPKS